MYTIYGCFSLYLILLFIFKSEQNEAKHDGSPSPGMTDQEKEMAASAYEAFTVNNQTFQLNPQCLLTMNVYIKKYCKCF